MMKSIAPLSLIVGVASAFSSGINTRRNVAPVAATTKEIESLVGASIECGGVVFDPLELAKWAPADHLRSTELANGRVAMLAVVGWFWPTVVGKFDAPDITTTDPIKAILEADPQWWAQFILLCGCIEGVKYRAGLQGKVYNQEDGPAFLDFTNQWGTYSKEEKDELRLQELKNGRLAMLGIATFVSHNLLPGSVPFLADGFWSSAAESGASVVDVADAVGAVATP